MHRWDGVVFEIKDNKATIKYDDGDSETGVLPKYIKLRE